MTRELAFDLVVIGGGINGAGIARDAAGRGLRVALLERGDLGGATSSASSKLIHGGLRYLEHFAVSLVRESLRERELLLRNAPHLVRPQRFVLPHDKGLRPPWQIGLGLWLYDRLRGRSVLPGARRLDLVRDPGGAPLRPGSGVGWEYSDCVTDDARLVVLTVADAARRGCRVLPRTECVGASRDGAAWRIKALDARLGASLELRAAALVNAGGPWAARLLGSIDGARSDRRLRLVKGSHIVVPRLYDGDQAFLLQNDDRRVVFVIPFERDFTLIGTTEVVVESPDDPVACSTEETEYLCRVLGLFFLRPVTPSDVVWSFAGLRPLVDDGRAEAGAISRDYVLDVDAAARGGAPLLSVFGGKLTTYRRLAERAVERLRPFFPGLAKAWTAGAPLPGGDFTGGPDALAATFTQRWPRLPPELLPALCCRHGTRAAELLAGVDGEADLGEHLGADLWEREVRWFQSHEWACETEDVLWRRTKCGLRLDDAQTQRVEACLLRAAPTC